MECGGENRREGDIALSALLSLHNIAMNGGVLHSVEHHSQDEIAAGVAGYRYFNLASAADVFEWVTRQTVQIDLASNLDAAEVLEAEADRRYAEVVPDDAILLDRFRNRFGTTPGAFAPLR